MAGTDSTFKSAIDENPFLAHGIELNGLIHNLKRHDPQWAGGMLEDMEPLRLMAIKIQARNVGEAANRGLRCLGATLAVAIDSGELPENDAVNAGWLVTFLAEIAEMANLYESNAQFDLDNLKLEASHGQH